MSVCYIGNGMVSTINIINSIKEATRGYQNCNTNQLLIFGGYVQVREAMCTCVIIWVNTILMNNNVGTILLMYQGLFMMSRPK